MKTTNDLLVTVHDNCHLYRCILVALEMFQLRYKTILEPAILRESELFYSSEGQRLVDDCDGPEYL